MSMLSRFALLPLALLAATSSCSDDDVGVDESDLTSNSALSRRLRFDGYVYVAPDASDSEILRTVRSQTQTAFGALRNAEIGVNSRELKDVDPATFKKQPVTVIDTSVPGDAGRPMLRVKYRYVDMAVVPKSMAKRSAITLAVLGTDYPSQSERVLEECTSNDEHARDFAGSLWYVFDPSLSSCQDAIAAEAKTIDEQNDALDDPMTQISSAELDRLYLPTTVHLGVDRTNKGTAYPEYDRLYSGGVEQDRLVIGLVNGLLDHDLAPGQFDSGYAELLTTLREIYKTGLPFQLVGADVDLLTFQLGDKTVTASSFSDLIAWELSSSGFPAGLSYDERKQLTDELYARLTGRWFRLEAPVTVTIGHGESKPFAIAIDSFFGASSDSTPHKRAIKNSDVFIYNGHSYIGYGPLDPSRFTAADFPASYQILFIDGCVSYNYYEKDYFPLKEGGTANLELITNGLEAPSWQSGYALGRFVATLLNGEQASYKDLLAAAEDTDSLRVVDGEIDNRYSPSTTPIAIDF